MKKVNPKKAASPLYNARRAKDLSMERLAQLAGTTHQQINRLELGERKLTGEWARRLAPPLGIEPLELVFPGESADANAGIPAAWVAAVLEVVLEEVYGNEIAAVRAARAICEALEGSEEPPRGVPVLHHLRSATRVLVQQFRASIQETASPRNRS